MNSIHQISNSDPICRILGRDNCENEMAHMSSRGLRTRAQRNGLDRSISARLALTSAQCPHSNRLDPRNVYALPWIQPGLDNLTRYSI
jgi:hypothetical protein